MEPEVFSLSQLSYSIIILLFLFDTTLQKYWELHHYVADSKVFFVGGIISAVNIITAKMIWSKTLNPKQPKGSLQSSLNQCLLYVWKNV